MTRERSDTFNLQTLVSFCLWAFAILAIFQADLLTWKEGIRLSLVTAGLGFLYLRYRNFLPAHTGRLTETPSDASDPASLQTYMSVLLAIVFMYILTQFSSSQTLPGGPLPDQTWFSIAGYIFVVILFVAAVVIAVQSPESVYLWKVDKLIYGIGASILVLIIGSHFLFRTMDPLKETFRGIMQIIGICAIYFTITRTYGILTGSDESGISFVWMKRTYKVVLSSFAVVLILIIFRHISGYSDYTRGDKLLDRGSYDEAFRYLQSANRKLSEASRDLYLKLAHASLGREDLQAASVFFRQAEALDTGATDDVYAQIGDLYGDFGHPKSAVDYYRKALSEASEDLTIYNRLCAANAQAGEKDDLLGLLREMDVVPEVQLRSKDAYAVLGIALLEAGMDRAAERYLKEATGKINTDPAMAVAWARAAVLGAHWEDALDRIQDGLKFHARSPELYYLLGVVNDHQKEQREAVAAWENALEYAPEHIYSLGALSAWYTQQGQEEEAGRLKAAMQISFSRSQWLGPQGPNLAWNGRCWRWIDFYEGKIQLRLKAHGTPAFGVWPRMVLQVGGRKIGEGDVKDGWLEYHFSAEIKTGRYRVDAAFVNDDGGPGEDRNLFVGDMKIDYR